MLITLKVPGLILCQFRGRCQNYRARALVSLSQHTMLQYAAYGVRYKSCEKFLEAVTEREAFIIIFHKIMRLMLLVLMKNLTPQALL